MRQSVRIVLVVVLLVVSLVNFAAALDTMSITYLLPPLVPGGDPVVKTKVEGVGVAASVLAGITVLITVVWTVLVVRRPRRPTGWFAVLSLVAVAVLVVAFVGWQINTQVF